MATCTICEQRKGKRYCTARGEDICTQCCAAEREVTVNCPFECGYLRESRLHEKRKYDDTAVLHPDVRIDAEFLEKNELVVVLMSAFLSRVLQGTPNARDCDAREALEAIVSSYRAGQDVLPEGAVAAGIARRFQERMGALAKDLRKPEDGEFADRVFLGIAVLMARVAHACDNDRPNCRAYVHFLRESYPDRSGAPEAAS